MICISGEVTTIYITLYRKKSKFVNIQWQKKIQINGFFDK